MVVSLTYREGHVEGEVFLAVSVARFILVHFRNGPAMFLDGGPQKSSVRKTAGRSTRGVVGPTFDGDGHTAHTSRTLSPTLWYKPGKYVFVPKAANGRQKERSSPF